MQTSFTMKSLLGGLALAAASVTWAQQTVPIFGLVELSGTGATSGSNFDNGVKLAFSQGAAAPRLWAASATVCANGARCAGQAQDTLEHAIAAVWLRPGLSSVNQIGHQPNEHVRDKLSIL